MKARFLHRCRIALRNQFALKNFSVFTLCVICVLCGKTSAQDFKQVHPGVEHAQATQRVGKEPIKINLLRLDPKLVRLDVLHAFDRAIGLEKTSDIARRHNALAAINAGFFRLDKSEFAGEAAGALMIDGALLSESTNSRAALLIANRSDRTAIKLAPLDIWLNLHVGPYVFTVNGINRERKAKEFILYTPEFGAATPKNEAGMEYIVDRNRIARIASGGEGGPIPRNGFVLSAAPGWNDDPNGLLKVNTRVRLGSRRGITSSADNFTADDITNGVSMLVRNGKVDLTWQSEKAAKTFAENRHPRSAIATLRGGKLLLVTVDGRQPEVSAGMTLIELANFLWALGAVDAMNLDGGGSTTMFLDGKVVNTPSDKEGERKIGDAIVVTLRKKK